MKALPQTLDDVFDAATRYAPSAASGRREAADVAAQQRYVQTQLIRGRGLLSHLLVDHLPSLVKPVCLLSFLTITSIIFATLHHFNTGKPYYSV